MILRGHNEAADVFGIRRLTCRRSQGVSGDFKSLHRGKIGDPGSGMQSFQIGSDYAFDRQSFGVPNIAFEEHQQNPVLPLEFTTKRHDAPQLAAIVHQVLSPRMDDLGPVSL